MRTRRVGPKRQTMAPRRRGRGIDILGAILIVAGLFAMFYGLSPAGAQDTAQIGPNGGTTEYFTEYSWSVLAGGNVQGTFQVLNGTPVTVFVFNDADYNAYLNGANRTGLYTVTASSGSIDVAVPGFNTYHLVFQHAPGYENVEQDVAVDLTSTGIDPGFFLGGIAAMGIGLVLVIFGVRRMRASSGQVPSGILDSRATYAPAPLPPSAPETTPGGAGVYRVPPPLPGSADSGASGEPAAVPTGSVVVSVENRSAGTETVQLLVNGAAVSNLSVPPGTSQVTTVTARLSSPFGSMVTIQAVTSGGRRAEQSVFVGAKGTAQVSLRIG